MEAAAHGRVMLVGDWRRRADERYAADPTRDRSDRIRLTPTSYTLTRGGYDGPAGADHSTVSWRSHVATNRLGTDVTSL